MKPNDVKVILNPKITEDQLWDFYVRNDICEAGYGDKKITAIPLEKTHLIVGAFYGDKLVGIVRVLHDGLSANIYEFGLELELQGKNQHKNGSLIENDQFGIAQKMGLLMKDELAKIGIDFINYYVVEGIEETFFESIGLVENIGHKVYIWDNRPYVNK
jgi:hypothetical protein